MAITFLDITNKVLRQLNEVPLSSSNFANAQGFHSVAKDAVNTAIFDINSVNFEWPFNYKEGTINCVVDQQLYDYETDCKTIDWHTFFREKNDSENKDGQVLHFLTYDIWHHRFRATDHNTDSGDGNAPEAVFDHPNKKIGLSPIPDATYTIKYNYWKKPVKLVNHDDELDIPDNYEHVVFFGAMREVNRFRENLEQSAVMDDKFEEAIKDMRTLLVNNYDRVYFGIPNRARYSW